MRDQHVTQPNIDPALLQQLLAAAQAQQAPAAAPSVGMPVQPAQPVAPPAPTQVVAVSDVLGRSGYGPALFDKNDPIGAAFTGTVAQPTQARQQRDFVTKQPKYYDDGNPIPELVIALDVPASPRHPEGRACWYARGKDIPEINRAMVDAGVPRELIKQGLEVGATVTVTYSHNQPSKFGNDAKIRKVQYTRPGQAPTPPASPAAQVPAAPGPVVAQPAAPAQPAVQVNTNPAAGQVDVQALLAQLGAAATPAA
jgi:hypothetical protein